MEISHFHSADLIFKHIKSIEEDLKTTAFSITAKYGNRLVSDIIQEVYIKCCTIYLDSNLLLSEFLKEVKEVCVEISFEYYYEEKKNYAKPTFLLSRTPDSGNGSDFDSLGADIYFETIGDEGNSGERKMIALEELAAITEIKGKWLNFHHAKEFVHLLRLRSKSEWEEYCKRKDKPKNIPYNPEIVYKNFQGWDDWFGNKYFNYEECCNWVQNNVEISTKEEWLGIIDKLPKEIPSNPEVYYSESGWEDWFIFLGVAPDNWSIKYRPYKDAMKWVQENLWKYSLTEKTWNEYLLGGIINAKKLPEDIPEVPDLIYKNTGWVSWYVWFGRYKDLARKFPISYYECRKWVKENIPNINTKPDWDNFIMGHNIIKKPEFMPPNPDVVFRNRGWCGWTAFLLNNGLCRKFMDGVFNTGNIRIKYLGEKIWVKPISVFKEIITGKVITVFCKPRANSEINFNASDIVSMNQLGEKKSLNRIASKYKYQI